MELKTSLSNYLIFTKVAETGNISEASKELFISQPAVSKAIRKLEDDLKVTLFTRNSRGVRLTEEGSLLYGYTKDAFSSLSQAEAALSQASRLGIGHIRIGASTTLCKYLLLPCLKDFVEQFPHVRITILCQSTFQTLELLKNEKIDIGLVGRPENLKNISFHPVGEIEDIFVATDAYLKNLNLREGSALSNKSLDSDLSNKNHSSDLSDENLGSVLSDENLGSALSGENLFSAGSLMLLDERNITRVYIDNYFARHQIHVGQVLEVGSMDLLIEFARTGLGIACVIREFVEEDLKSGCLCRLPLPAPIPKREVGFSWLKNRGLPEPAQKFIQFAFTASKNIW